MNYDQRTAYLPDLKLNEAVPLNPGSDWEGPDGKPIDCCRRRTRRFCHFLFAFVIFSGLAIRYLCTRHASGMEVGNYHPQGRPLPPDVTFRDCATWVIDHARTSPGRYIANASLQLPVDSDHLFFLTAGPEIPGRFHLVQSERVSDEIEVEVTATYSKENLFTETILCHLDREGGGDGVGILTPPPHSFVEHFELDIVVNLPKTSTAGGTLNIHSFVTDLPMFVHEVEDLASTVTFGELELNSQFGTINVKSVLAEEAMITTSHGSIAGTFNTSRSLSLSTVHGPISARVGMFNPHDRLEEKDTKLLLQTRHGAIKAEIDLISTSPSHMGGLFTVEARASSGKIDLAFPFASPRSLLDMESSVKHGENHVQLHPSYEGKFHLQSSRWGHVSDLLRYDVKDPEGRSRVRRIEMDRNDPKSVHGEAWWEDEGRDRVEGSVHVKTEFGKVELEL